MTLRVYLHSPKVAMVAKVDMHGFHAVYPQDEIDFMSVSVGSHTAIQPGMTVLYGSAPGRDDRGRNRIRYIDPTNPSFRTQVGRFSRGIGDGEVDIGNDTEESWVYEDIYMTVLEDYRVWAKIPHFLGGVIWKDSDINAFGTVDKPPPVANGGPGVAGDINPATGFLTVTFNGSNSWAFSMTATPPNVGVDAFLWEVGDGIVVGGTTTSSSLTVNFPRGFRYVYLTVTGGDHGKQHSCSVPVFARDPSWASDPTISEYHVINHTQTLVGQEIALEFFTPLPRDQYPDGTLMMMWDDNIAYDPAGRLHMQFVGWHQQDEVNMRADETATLHSTQMIFYDVCRRLESLPGFSQVVEHNPAPTQWTQTKFPVVLYYFWYLLYWHSTALEVADLLLEVQLLNFFKFVVLGSDRQNLYAQVNSLAQMITPDHRLCCSRQGQMRLPVDPMIQNKNDRLYSAAYVWDTLDDTDWQEIRYTYRRAPRVQQIRAVALLSSDQYVVVDGLNTIAVIASLAPGGAHGQGEQYLETDQRIAGDQFQLNISEGNRYARLNSRYGRFAIVLPFERMNTNLDLSLPRWVNVTITGANHPEREVAVSFSNQPGIVYEMSITYDYQEQGLVRTVTLQWEMETYGPPAQTYNPAYL